MYMEKKEYIRPAMVVKVLEDPLLFSTNTSGAGTVSDGSEGGAKENNSFVIEDEDQQSVW